MNFVENIASIQLTAFFLPAPRIDDMNAKEMIPPANGQPRIFLVLQLEVRH
jgi:hypothetical protein